MPNVGRRPVSSSNSRASRNFVPYSKGRPAGLSTKFPQTWTHDFVCLSKVNESYTPTQGELTNLRLAGLGKKKIVFKNKFGDHRHIQDSVESYFPRYDFILYLFIQKGDFQDFSQDF